MEMSSSKPIDRLETPLPFQAELIENHPSSVDDLIFQAMMLQAKYCRVMQKNLEALRHTLMELFSGENRKQCAAFATTGAKSWKYMGAALQIGAAVLPFSGAKEAVAAAQGVGGAGSAAGSIGGTWDEHNSGQRTKFGHTEGNFRRQLDQTDRSNANAYSQFEALVRLVASLDDKMHNAKTAMVRGC